MIIIFRNSYSTDSCLTQLTDQIRFDMDKGNYTVMVMIDLQKAFDTVDHGILLNKLKAIGLDDLSTSWFSSYLKNSFQKTEVGSIFSDPMVVPRGLPLGSILGPLLFLIYVNDMKADVSCRLILYADDSALLVSGTSVFVIEETLGHELTFPSEWLVDNKLSILLGKTESILFGSNKKIRKQSIMKIICGDDEVTAKDNVKYLGVSLDLSLGGKYIAESNFKKGNSGLKFLWRQAKYLNRNSRKLLATSLILCHFDYACSAWFEGLQVNLQKKLKNKTMIFVLGYPPRSHIGIGEFTLLHWIPVCQKVKQIKLNNMYRIVHGNAPQYLKWDISMVNDQHFFSPEIVFYQLFYPM